MFQIFIDSDVVISSLKSNTKTGAGYVLLHTPNITARISSISLKELERVIVGPKLSIKKEELYSLIERRLHVIKLHETIEELKKQYRSYVFDINDAHIVAGAKIAGAQYLITYNLKHFNESKIRESFNIQVMTPGSFLQYLRRITFLS